MGLAKELVFTGRRIAAAEAVAYGVANRAVPATEFMGVVNELAASLASSATIALGLSKQLLEQSLQSSLEEIAALEVYGQAVLYSTNDNAEARAAFVEKRKPAFTGS
jgi:2-(1,2-epoxy-1,2-dihydrophenyl)acetyl-CoA isomerase